MAFIGSIPKEARILIQDKLREVPRDKGVYVLCSGNFTLDKIANKMGFKVHGNDVSLYSKLIADYVLGNVTKWTIKDKQLEKIYKSWEGDEQLNKLIFAMFVLSLSEFKDLKNSYQIENYQTIIDGAKEYHEKTYGYLTTSDALNFEMVDYYHGDLVERAKEVGDDDLMVVFAPTYTGGYEKMFKFLEDVIDYERASYEMFDSKAAGTLYKQWLEEKNCLIYSDVIWEGLEQYIVSKIKYNNKRDVYLYSNIDKDGKHLFEVRDKLLDSPMFDIAKEDFEFTDDTIIEVYKRPVGDANYYKQSYMSAKVDYSMGGDFSIVFVADKKVFGFATFSKFLSNLEYVFVQSDFVVPIDFPRVSKLLIMLLKGKDCHDIVNNEYKNYYEMLRTSVFTRKPVSMKYRGAWKKEESGEEGKLIYQAEFDDRSLTVIYKEWLKRTRQATKNK